MALNYPFVYSIFSWCAKGIVILNKIKLFSNDKKRLLHVGRSLFRYLVFSS